MRSTSNRLKVGGERALKYFVDEFLEVGPSSESQRNLPNPHAKMVKEINSDYQPYEVKMF